LFVLQIVIAVSPLVESREEGRLIAHVEQDGTRHVNLHNEATCALCSVRAQKAMPAPAATPVGSARSPIAPTVATYTAPLTVGATTNRSRAPPRLV
jgi:hypothetical protein